MFKLTYQAYIMFAMTMAYVIFRFIAVFRKKILKAAGGTALFLLICTWGYFGNSVGAWFGNVLDPSQYRGLNATAFLETDFPEDAAGIRWLNEAFEKQYSNEACADEEDTHETDADETNADEADTGEGEET